MEPIILGSFQFNLESLWDQWIRKFSFLPLRSSHGSVLLDVLPWPCSLHFLAISCSTLFSDFSCHCATGGCWKRSWDISDRRWQKGVLWWSGGMPWSIAVCWWASSSWNRHEWISMAVSYFSYYCCCILKCPLFMILVSQSEPLSPHKEPKCIC